MIEEQDFEKLQARFDDRYKKISECNSDMDALNEKLTQVYVKVAEIATNQDSQKWLLRSILGAIIVAIVGAVAFVITKGG